MILCLKLKINEELILKRPLKTSDIEAGLKELLAEGEYHTLAQLLRLREIDLTKIYHDCIDEEQLPYLLNVYNFFIDGFMLKEDVKLIITAKIVSDHSTMLELSANEIMKLPNNPLSNELSVASDMNEQSLLVSLQRGLQEKDQSMIWTTWPLETPLSYQTIWKGEPELWRILLVETVCDGQVHVKENFLYILKMAVNRLQKPSKLAESELLMINISLFSFYLEILRIKEHIRTSRQVQGQFTSAVDKLEQDALNLFDAIKNSPVKKNSRLFAGFEPNSAHIINQASQSLLRNPFHYEARIELFASILKILRDIPNFFADWFSNFYCSFTDVIPIMSLDLLLEAWKVFLSKSPSVEAVCSLLAWLTGRIEEEYRLRIAQEIPESLLTIYYQMCLVKHIPKPLSLIPYELRESEYLKKSRGGTREVFSYDMREFWKPQVLPITKLLKVFEMINSDYMDLYETIDTFFILEPGASKIGLSKFLEIILGLFMSVREWYMVLKEDEGRVPEIIPSPLFPPALVPILVKIIVRCRQVCCRFPFRISDQYLRLAFYDGNGIKPVLTKFVNSQLKYLANSRANRLPGLSMYYVTYITLALHVNVGNSGNNNNYDFLRKHYTLYLSLKSLWAQGQESNLWDLTPDRWEKLKQSLHETAAASIERFNLEMHRQLGPVTFSRDELSRFFLISQ